MNATNNSNYQDFGFSGEEFSGEVKTPPYCQFLNANNKSFGLAISQEQAELAGFYPDENWQETEHEFSDGTIRTMLFSKNPKLVIINRSRPMMSKGKEVIPYNREKSEEYEAFSYAIVWLLDEYNQPLSEQPFRLKCSGYSGLTFIKNYEYYNNPNSFCKQFLSVYKNLTKERAIEKNDVFYAV